MIEVTDAMIEGCVGRALTAALSEAPDPWRPIETAPKQERVDLWCADREEPDRQYRLPDCELCGGEWSQHTDDGEFELENSTPLRWMPLPSPPKSEAARRGLTCGPLLKPEAFAAACDVFYPDL